MVELFELCLTIVDCEHKTAPKSDEGYPLIRTTDIGRGRLDLSNVQRVDAEAYEEWTRRTVPQPGDLILAREAPVGNVAIVTSGLEPVLGQRTVLIRPDLDQVDPDYLTYRLLAYDLQHWMNGVANGSTVPHLNMEDIRSLPIPALPPLEEQRAVGGALAALDDLIENNRRRIKILEEMARLIYREWFVHFRFPGHEDVEFVDSDLGQIPVGWEPATLGDVSENFDRLRKPLSKTERSEMQGEFPYYGAAKIVDHVNDWIFDGEYLLFAEDGTVVTSDGFPVLQLVNEKFWVNNHTHILQGDGLPTRLLWLAVTGYPISGHVTGAAQPKITQANLKRVPVLRPEETIVDAFMAVIDPMVDLVQTLSRQNGVLTETRDLLPPRLISGELDVSDLDLDLEPVT